MSRSKTLLMMAVLTALSAGSAWAAPPTPTPPPSNSPTAPPPAPDRHADGKRGGAEHARHGGDRRHAHPGAGRHDALDRLDTNRDGRISQAEAAAHPHLAEQFAQRDLNRDGYLDAQDRQLRQKQRRDEWFARVDTNRDGALTRAEIDAADAARRQQAGERRQARRAEHFAALDSNKDGRISAEEAKGKPHLVEHFKTLDANQDGFISQDELKPRARH